MTKTKFIILSIFLCFLLGIFIVSFKICFAQIGDYRCNECNSSGSCVLKTSTKPCSDDCSGCEKYKCKVCSGTECKQKTFDSTCSDVCSNDYTCGLDSSQPVKDCYVCSGSQCVSKTQDISCSDKCTGSSQCKDVGDDDEGPGWSCEGRGDCSSGTCRGECVYTKHGGDYPTEDACKRHGCCFCCICRKSYTSVKQVCRCEGCSKGCTGCRVDADCQTGTPPTTPPPTTPPPTTPPPTSPSPKCSVKATANPNPIPQGQDKVTISATSLSHTSLSKCKVSGYSLPHTFTQTGSSVTYTVKCTGNSGYDDCSSRVTVTKQGTTPTPTPTTTTTTTTTIPPCRINNFSVSDRAWAYYDVQASWSVNSSCESSSVKVTCSPYPDCNWQKTLGKRSGSETFIVDKAGFYTYTLEASGIGGTKTKTETLEVLHLPIWQEINPVLPDKLQGFLRGLWD